MRPIELTEAVALLALALTPGATAAAPSIGAEIPGRYVVVLDQGVARGPGESVLEGPSVADVAQHMALRYDANPGRIYEHALSGFVLAMDPRKASDLARDPRVLSVEPDRLVSPAGVQADPPSWGLDRIDQRAGLDGLYRYPTAESEVHVFVIDSGIRSTHSDFGGRVDTGSAFTAIEDGLGSEDCYGHGTHVAGIIGGSRYGVAKAVTLHPARVLDCSGVGALSDVIAAVDWITSLKSRGKLAKAPFVANLSLGGGFTWALDTAIWSAVHAGVVVTLAAGNAGEDPCALPVYGRPEVLTVGASGPGDSRAADSNFGGCLDVYAPGVDIVSAFIRHDDDSVYGSGTSFAAPHVAGAAALYLAAHPSAPVSEVHDAILATATPGLLGELGDGSPDLLLYVDGASISEPGTPIGPDEPPTAAFTFRCNDRQGSCSFDATASADDVGIVAYGWDLGDGSGADGSKVRHEYPSSLPGATYSVELTVIDTAGQSSSIRRDIAF